MLYNLYLWSNKRQAHCSSIQYLSKIDMLFSYPLVIKPELQCLISCPPLCLCSYNGKHRYRIQQSVNMHLFVPIWFEDENMLLKVEGVQCFSIHVSVLRRASAYFNDVSFQPTTRSRVSEFEIVHQSIIEVDYLLHAIYGLDR